MKKIILATMMGLALSSPTKAEDINCEGGDILNATSGTYCVSKVTMNWYTAWAWCDSLGLTLQNMSQACNTDTFTFRGDTQNCKGLSGAKFANGRSNGIGVWTAEPNTTTTAFYVYLNNGTVPTDGNYYRLSTHSALCR